MLHITTYKKDARSRYIKIDAKFKVGGALCFFFGKDCHKIRTLAPARPWGGGNIRCYSLPSTYTTKISIRVYMAKGVCYTM
jgi:hypothetical protein